MRRLAIVLFFLLGWGARGIYEALVEYQQLRLEIARVQRGFALMARAAADSARPTERS